MSPSSPWPELEYDPEYVRQTPLPDTPRQQYNVEVCVVPPQQGGGDGAVGEGEGESPTQALCGVRMAQVFEEKPYLREQLVDLHKDLTSGDVFLVP